MGEFIAIVYFFPNPPYLGGYLIGGYFHCTVFLNEEKLEGNMFRISKQEYLLGALRRSKERWLWKEHERKIPPEQKRHNSRNDENPNQSMMIKVTDDVFFFG